MGYNLSVPGKNTIKEFLANSYYHLYNRGVEKRKIFIDNQDYNVFISYLRTYLLPKNINDLQSVVADPNISWKEKADALKLLRMNNFSDTLSLLTYCLMPNHFHFLINQIQSNTIDRFMNSLFTRYSMYFNKKYQRVGTLFQGVYKAVRIVTDKQLIYLSRYIHRNPFQLLKDDALEKYQYHSYRVYLEKEKLDWVKPDDVLAHFSITGFNSYRTFVEDGSISELQSEKIECLVLDN